MENKNCDIRMVPCSIAGFVKLQMAEANDRSRWRNRRDNQDLEKFASNKDNDSVDFARDETADILPEPIGNNR